jgi:RimJ/RimL family protein N-acetyltransferase
MSAGPPPVTFRTAAASSLDDFLAVSAHSPYQAELRAYTESLLEQRCTRLSWCVIATVADIPVARAAFWAPPGHPLPTDLVLIAADWDDPELEVGRQLLAYMHDSARFLRASALQHHVDAPPGAPQYQGDTSARIRLLADAGYELQRDGLRWHFAASAVGGVRASSRLTFRDLSESGDDEFVAAIASTYEGTRDSLLNRHIEEHGRIEAARADFRDYKQLEHRPDWWELAYRDDGTLVGVSMAARNPTSAVIAYVGVVPAQRGNGFAAALVRRGTERLVTSGAREIRGDCDRDNTAMVKAFKRAGYEEVARRRTYLRKL